MSYDFDKQIDRRHTCSYKWNIGDHELPMWVADMDFEIAPEILAALENKLSEHVYGYQIIPDAWYHAYISWWRTRHQTEFTKDSLIFCTGVIPAISSIVRKLTTPAENVLVQTPVYNVFFNSIYNNGRNILENKLKYTHGQYEIDFEDLEAKLSDPQTTLFILCNPHNPIGRIWDKDTLIRIGALCQKYHVTVLSDEIHCDLTDPGTSYTPYALASDICRNHSITCLAPTKAFNIAGLQTAAVAVPNPALRHKVWRALNTDEVAEPNILAVPAAIAAFSQGAAWLDALRNYIYDNKQYVKNFLEHALPKIHLIPSDATYLLWLDCRAYSEESDVLCRMIREKTGLYLNNGKAYRGDGRYFLRMNIACPRANVVDGMNRLKAALDAIGTPEP